MIRICVFILFIVGLGLSIKHIYVKPQPECQMTENGLTIAPGGSCNMVMDLRTGKFKLDKE